VISLIVAASMNNVIGADGKLPWHLPADLRRFKEITMGKPIVMGRLTYESIGRPLPGRQNIVITRQSAYEAHGCDVVGSIDAAIERAGNADELMVIGGGELYRQFLALADRVYMTRVQTSVAGDACFPELCQADWDVVDRQAHAADERNAFACEFITLQRRVG
jgi:dihydrofolate reductase